MLVFVVEWRVNCMMASKDKKPPVGGFIVLMIKIGNLCDDVCAKCCAVDKVFSTAGDAICITV